MVIETRRNILKHIALGLGVALSRGVMAQPAEDATYVGVETASDNGLSKASFFSASGRRLSHVELDFRAHGMAEYGNRLVVFPRRPGDRFAIIDQATFEIQSIVTAPMGRHFFGHGAVTGDGRHLLVTENDLETLQGSIGVYELGARTRRLGQIALPGAGPHEIVRHPDQDIFYIALGGLETHPDYGRSPLNLDTFRSQIVILDFPSETLSPMGYWSGTEGISLRHLAMDHRERLYIGGQVKNRDRTEGESVVWLWDGKKANRIQLEKSMGGYVSSVAAHGSQALVSSKQSGTATLLDGTDSIWSTKLDGASAVALGNGLTALSGYQQLSINGRSMNALKAHEFDNHGQCLLQL